MAAVVAAVLESLAGKSKEEGQTVVVAAPRALELGQAGVEAEARGKAVEAREGEQAAATGGAAVQRPLLQAVGAHKHGGAHLQWLLPPTRGEAAQTAKMPAERRAVQDKENREPGEGSPGKARVAGGAAVAPGRSSLRNMR
jgi:hypothetical protein